MDFLDLLVTYNSQTTGRDKLVRLVQYTSKLLGWIAEKCKYEKLTINKLTNLEYSLGTGRKMLRMGRSVDSMYGAVKTIQLTDLTLRVTLTTSKISQSFYLLTDHILWFGRVGLFDIDKRKWSRLSNMFWLLSVLLLLARDVYDLWHITTTEMRLRANCVILSDPTHPFTMALGYKYTPSTCAPLREEFLHYLLTPVARWAVQHLNVVLDTVRNACDLVLAVSGLDSVKFSSGFIAVCGIVSSAIGILGVINPAIRLV